MEEIKHIYQVNENNLEDAKRNFVYFADKFYEGQLSPVEIDELCLLGYEILNFSRSARHSKGKDVLTKKRSKLKEFFLPAKKSELVTLEDLCEVMVDVIGSTIEHKSAKIETLSADELKDMRDKASEAISFCNILLAEIGEITPRSSSSDVKKFNECEKKLYTNQEIIERVDKILGAGENTNESGPAQRG